MGYNQFNRHIIFTPTTKECSWCLEVKPHSEFHKDANNRYKLAYYCKPCAISKSRAHHNNRKNDIKYKTAKKNDYIKHIHGITLVEYNEKLRMQDYKCAICSINIENKGHYDHCHKTGKYRAFLCSNCNRGLGHFQDSKEILSNAIDYLNKHTSNVDTGKEVTNDYRPH